MKTLFATVILAGFVATASADLIATNLVIKSGTSATLTFPSREPATAEVALLTLLARLESPRLGGSTYAMRLQINGQPLETEHIINKPAKLTMRDGRKLGWFAITGWRVPYAPDFTTNEKSKSPISITDPEPHRWTFDVTRLLRSSSNRLVVIAAPNLPLTSPLAVEQVELVFKPSEFVKRVKWEDEEEPVWTGSSLFVPAEKRRVKYCVTERGDRALRVSYGFSANSKNESQDYIDVESEFRCADPKAFCVKRKVRSLAECVEVTDTIENLTDNDIGLMIHHRVPLADRKIDSLHLCGWPKTMKEGSQHQAMHPSVFVTGDAGSFALLARDDVFRVHCRSALEGGVASINDERFGLAPHASYTMRWNIFPVPSREYWDFINAARRTLDVNFTLDGPMGFIGTPRASAPVLTDVELKAFADNRSLRYVSGGIPYTEKPKYRYLHGSGYLEAGSWAERTKELLQRLAQLRPGLIPVTYFHEFISTETDSPEKYRDARVIRSDGTQGNYPYHYPLPMFCPTLDNSYGRTLPGFFDWARRAVGVQGIYWDEMDGSSETYTYDGRWDGHTVVMDPKTLKILHKPAMITLLSQEWRIKQAKAILRWGSLIANGQPQTDSMMRVHFVRFVETGDINHLINAQLYTPVGLGDHLTERNEKDIARQIRAHLRFGCLYYYYGGHIKTIYPQLTSRMYPFTPIELHPGVLIGKERILTARSGTFGWGDRSKHEVHVFDNTGREVPDFKIETTRRNGATLTELSLTNGWSAAIVRK
ncbi:MAG: hypothetical protein PHR77_11370 [Kiritimatiellae bacterium]|nr:hypothetical protein [Kiritimatiellia bacterium]MDD5522797.1 hypothetical protein [Kiritimatiellia bacterium]